MKNTAGMFARRLLRKLRRWSRAFVPASSEAYIGLRHFESQRWLLEPLHWPLDATLRYQEWDIPWMTCGKTKH
jgi:hypothetical protein